jgi:glycosyltransferase involved in cell wall biosynthesis
MVMLPTAYKMARKTRYDLVHAVEESVYMAMLIKRRFGIPYLYDMDSSLARQIAEKFGFLKFLLPLMARTEGAAIKGALGVVPVCDALAVIARADQARKIFLLRDISLMQPTSNTDRAVIRELIPDNHRPRFLYLGNLETYQGADFLLESFARFINAGGNADLIIAGGKAIDVSRYQAKAVALGIGEQTRFLGHQPINRMSALFEMADILVSPRIKGNNTPMKIYSYLASGKAILATALPTHTQVLTPEVALLAPAQIEPFASAMAQLANTPTLRTQLGQAARTLAEQSYSQDAFLKTTRALYAWVKTEIPASP